MTKAIKKNGDQVWHVCLRRRMHLLYLHSHAQAMRVGEGRPRPHDLNSAKAQKTSKRPFQGPCSRPQGHDLSAKIL